MTKAIYFGALTEVPIKEITSQEILLNGNTIDKYFTVTNTSDNKGWTLSYIEYETYTSFVLTPNNIGVNSVTATITLKANQDIPIGVGDSGDVAVSYQYVTESNYDKVTLKVGDTTILSSVSGTASDTMTASYINSTKIIPKDTSIVVTYTKDSSSHASGEKVKISFIIRSIISDVETIIGYETKGIAHKVKRAYIGVENISHKVKKGYVGIGGIARLFFSSSASKVLYLESLSSSSYNVEDSTFSMTADYALLGGGDIYANVYAYDKSLTRKNVTDLNIKRYNIAGGQLGNYAIFAGGRNNATDFLESDYSIYTDIDVYDNSLTKITGTLPSGVENARFNNTSRYALLGGGSNNDELIVFDSSLTCQAGIAPLDKAGISPSPLTSAAKVGDYALFTAVTPSLNYVGSGCHSNSISAYNDSLTKTSLNSGLTGRRLQQGISFGNHAIFAGGIYQGGAGSTSFKEEAIAISKSLTITNIPNLTKKRIPHSGGVLDDYAIIFKGVNSYDSEATPVYSPCSTVDVYDTSFTLRTDFTHLNKSYGYTHSEYINGHWSANVGNYLLFKINCSTVIEVYTFE